MLLLPLPAYPAYNVITTIDGVDYELVYTYDEHRDLWRLGVNSESGDAIMGHRPLFPFVRMRPNAFGSALDGVFALVAPLPSGDAFEALVGGLWSVVYGDPGEIAELESSLADLVGDVNPEPEPEPEPSDWDGEYETLPNLVAGWLPDRGLYKDAEGTQLAGESDGVLGWRDFVQNALLPHGEGDVAFVIGGIATISQNEEGAAVGLYAGLDLSLAGSITEAVVGSVPREGGVEPLSFILAGNDAEEPSLVLMVANVSDGVSLTLIGDVEGFDQDGFIALPETPSFPVSLRVAGANAELVNLSGVLGEQEGYAEPVEGVEVMQVVTMVEGAANIPLTPVLLFSEPLPAEIRTQLLNKLRDDFPAWN